MFRQENRCNCAQCGFYRVTHRIALNVNNRSLNLITMSCQTPKIEPQSPVKLNLNCPCVQCTNPHSPCLHRVACAHRRTAAQCRSEVASHGYDAPGRQLAVLPTMNHLPSLTQKASVYRNLPRYAGSQKGVISIQESSFHGLQGTVAAQFPSDRALAQRFSRLFWQKSIRMHSGRSDWGGGGSSALPDHNHTSMQRQPHARRRNKPVHTDLANLV
jgi:hypothetical protein